MEEDTTDPTLSTYREECRPHDYADDSEPLHGRDGLAQENEGQYGNEDRGGLGHGYGTRHFLRIKDSQHQLAINAV